MLDTLCVYEEIKHLNRQQQDALIQQAKYEAYTTLRLGTQGILFFFFSVLLAASAILLSLRFIASPIASAFGLAVFLLSYKITSKSLISKGLKSLLAKQVINVKSVTQH